MNRFRISAPRLWACLPCALILPTFVPVQAGANPGGEIAQSALVGCAINPLASSGVAVVGAVSPTTPYISYVPPSTFIQGGMLEWDGSVADRKERITYQLQDMRDKYNINTVNIYGLENFDSAGSNTHKDWLFAELGRLGMQIVVRIESYNTSSFAFTSADVTDVMSRYTALINYVSAAANRGKVAYFAVNMPVDDPGVQSRLGGVNSALSKQRQREYAVAVISAMRSRLNSAGFSTAKNYLSVFYGWDNSYDVPSYADAGADGYFINNYSYPAGAPLDPSASDSALINQSRLQIAMNKFTSTYGNSTPFVMEYGFHTVEYNNGTPPNQTAGLVQNLLAKNKALKATTNYYKNTFPGVRGSLYFGYNLFKSEGSPPAVMDWALAYPVTGTRQAETGTRYGNARIYADSAASGGQGIAGLDATMDGVAFFNQRNGSSLQIRYAAATNAQLSLYINGTYRQKIILPSTGSWTGAYATKTVSIPIPSAATVKLQRDSGDSAANLDWVTVP